MPTASVNFELQAVNVLMNEAVKLSHDQFVMDLVTKGVHIGIMDKHFMPFGRELGVGWELATLIQNGKHLADAFIIFHLQMVVV